MQKAAPYGPFIQHLQANINSVQLQKKPRMTDSLSTGDINIYTILLLRSCCEFMPRCFPNKLFWNVYRLLLFFSFHNFWAVPVYLFLSLFYNIPAILLSWYLRNFLFILPHRFPSNRLMLCFHFRAVECKREREFFCEFSSGMCTSVPRSRNLRSF